MLSAALNRVLEITQTGMGNVQLAESGRLRMVRPSGLAREFTSFFAFVDQQTTSCAQAAEQRRQVTVRDVATEDAFDEGSRQVILRAGSRGLPQRAAGQPGRRGDRHGLLAPRAAAARLQPGPAPGAGDQWRDGGPAKALSHSA